MSGLIFSVSYVVSEKAREGFVGLTYNIKSLIIVIPIFVKDLYSNTFKSNILQEGR